MYRDYYIRALPKDWPTLLALGQTLGAITVTTSDDGSETVSCTGPGCWDFLGVLFTPTGKTIDTDEGPVPEMKAVTDAKGTAYWHANLRTTMHLGEVAREMAAADKQVAKALQSLGKFFLLDEEGNPRTPSQPARGFA